MTSTGSTFSVPKAALGLVVAVAAAYANSFSGAFVFDDKGAILDNATLQNWRDLGALLAPPAGTTAAGRPFLNLTLAVNHAISGNAVWSYHLLNLAIHAASALALFGVVRRTALRFAPLPSPTLFAFAVSLLWALHPIQTESVTYIVQRTESMMGLFYLLTLYCFIRGIETSPAAVGPRSMAHGVRSSGLWPLASVIACVAGSATKEVMATAPIMVLLYDRTFVAGSFRAAWRARRGYYLALAAIWLILAVLVFSGGGDRAGGFETGRFSAWWGYWLTQTKAVLHYIRLTLWPSPLVFDYGFIRVGSIREVIVPALVLLVLLAATAWALVRRPIAGFLAAWFFVILAPSSIMPGTIQMIVEHRMYLSLAAPIVALVGIAWRFAPRAAWPGAFAAACICGVLTILQNRVYATEDGLWRDVISKQPGNARAHYNLGYLRLAAGKPEEALELYRAAIELDPRDMAAENNLGDVLLKLRRNEEAIAAFQAALTLAPRNVNYNYNLGIALNAAGKPGEAEAQFRKVVEIDPRYGDGWNTLGITLDALGRTANAIPCYERALQLQPSSFEAANNLGCAFIKTNRIDDAVTWLERACGLAPGSVDARINLAIALARSGRTLDAVARLREALVIDPANADARGKLDTLLRQ